ncbi:MAG TPA: 4Fe-4S double cluster binding domain-containing protein [Candidatus Deferrimicrobium sp.]|nr:4Fe-4S double cluster binding domain-containing protein [Candidatus Deferrimicrobium sp.]
MVENKEITLTDKVKKFITTLDLDIFGIASANNALFSEAPVEYQPRNILEGAQSVLVIGKTVPKGTFKLNYHRNNIVHRLYHSIYKFLDITATRISDFLESLGYYAIPIPSYIPLTMRNLEPWGIISLKHAAVAAGLGEIARNGLFIHPKFGTLIRLSGIITTAELVPNLKFEGEICRDCNLCIDNCPAKAFDKKGQFMKLACLRDVIKHGINILHPYDKNYVKNLELITNTMMVEYTVGCTKCLEVCPINIAPLKEKERI